MSDKSDKSFVDVNNTRPGEYTKVIESIRDGKFCPFCTENITIHHDLPITEKKYWLMTNNKWPYQPSKHHILLIHKVHIVEIEEISPEAWIELKEILAELRKERGIAGGSFLLRFGDTKYTGASVTHLHAHLMQSDPEKPLYKGRIKINNDGVIKDVDGLWARLG